MVNLLLNPKEFKYIPEVIEMLLENKAHKATKYLSDRKIIRATRKAYQGKFTGKELEIILTIGKPNYREREQIKSMKKKDVFKLLKRSTWFKYLPKK